MRLTDYITANFGQKALALMLAIILWFSVTMGQEGEVEYTVPVVPVNVSSGLKIEGAPENIELKIAGPRYLLMGLGKDRLTVRLDLKGAGEGPILLTGLDRSIQLRRELRVTRIRPSTIELNMVTTR
jgi:YbbR domain-containing protein